MKKGTRLLFSLGITLASALLMFYMFIPAINIHSVGFWMYVIILLTIFGVINFGTGLFSIKRKTYN